MEPLFIFGFILILVVIITYQCSSTYCKKKLYDGQITGYWVADKTYCEEAEIDMFCMLIGKKEYNGERCCYILAKQDGEVIINEPTTIILSQKSQNSQDEIKYLAKFGELETEEFPQKQSMTYYCNSSKIMFHIKDDVYAVLYKDPVLSEQYTELKKIKNSKKIKN